jgi:CO dehydrogenase maturation factor
MKLLVSGKGGAGKSAISLLLAKTISEKRKVILMDADESNRLLANSLGLNTPDTIANYLGGRGILRDEIKEYEKIRISDLPDDYVAKTGEGIIFAAVGKIEEFGEGCACPYGFLSKELLKRIELDDDEFLIVDTEAGIEHLGRGIEEGIDDLLVVVDPTAEGVAIAEKLASEAKRIGKNMYIILNKMTPEVEPIMFKLLNEKNLEADLVLSYDPMIFKSSLMGKEFDASVAAEQISFLTSQLLAKH